MQDFEVPQFMIDRAIKALETHRNDIDAEISRLRSQRAARDWRLRHKHRTAKIVADLIKRGMTDENQARDWICQQGHSWNYAGEILSAMQIAVKDSKKAARDVEIFRRYLHGKEKKTSLAREFGLSRATVERICRRMMVDGEGLRKVFRMANPPQPVKRKTPRPCGRGVPRRPQLGV